MAVAYLARWAGPVNESSDKYGDSRTTAAKVLKHVQAAVMLPGRTSVSDNDLIKQLVVEYGAMSVGMYYAGRFDTSVNGLGARWPTYYSGKVLDNGDDVEAPDEVPENHGVDVVGWDDAYPRTKFAAASGQPPGDGAFLVRNSYGASYGDDGYFWVSYHDQAFAFGPLTSYTRVDGVSNYARNYQYDTPRLDPVPRVRRTARSPNEAWGANRFVAKATERIAAAGFYAPAAGAAYEVWAGPSLARLSLRAQGTQALPGFTTVDFSTPLTVRKGASFVVALRMVTPGRHRAHGGGERLVGGGAAVLAVARRGEGRAELHAQQRRRRVAGPRPRRPHRGHERLPQGLRAQVSGEPAGRRSTPHLRRGSSARGREAHVTREPR